MTIVTVQLIYPCNTNTMKKKKDETISLDDYQTFQYMLASPSIAKDIVNEITSFVFYNVSYVEDNMKQKHIIAQGSVSVINYYCCCLVLLPSHILRMSRWVSPEDYQYKYTKTNKKIQSGDILRRFRYSFYLGMISVETLHIYEEEGTKFRLVESIICPISPWVVVHAVFLVVSVLVVYCLQSIGLFIETAFLSLVVSMLVVFHSLLLLTGVKTW